MSCTANLERPRSRRRFSTLRPPGELMRLRKPCVRSRLRTLGCQVRFVAIRICSCHKWYGYKYCVNKIELFSNGYYKGSLFALSNFLSIKGNQVKPVKNLSAICRTFTCHANSFGPAYIGSACYALWVRQKSSTKNFLVHDGVNKPIEPPLPNPPWHQGGNCGSIYAAMY